MYPVCGDENTLVTLIPASQVIPPPSPPPTTDHPPPTQVVGICSLAPPQQDILLALPGTLLHDVILTQRSSLDSIALLSKLTPEHLKEGAYILKESIVYQNKQIWVPKSLRACVMTEHHEPLLFGHPGTKKLLELIRRTYSWVGITKVLGLGLSSVSPVHTQNQIAQATTASSTPSSRQRVLGRPSW
ncbi:hypothetical protein DSO57_1023812 [Entomophthora muscae]|uniref:Uncharacterized protein n=1 Tax=Entomophthora muscae TaxID=34485 RepID=A0ACC2UCK5_9FUNG|nr:hypothetical protein DSO57_1023812 [Entomophthora muscae]